MEQSWYGDAQSVALVGGEDQTNNLHAIPAIYGEGPAFGSTGVEIADEHPVAAAVAGLAQMLRRRLPENLPAVPAL